MDVFGDCLLANDIAGLQPLGDRLPGVMKFVMAAAVGTQRPEPVGVVEPSPPLLADLGIAARTMPMTETTADFGSVVVEITQDLKTRDELIKAARLVGGSGP
jgi:hypothetical protein